MGTMAPLPNINGTNFTASIYDDYNAGSIQINIIKDIEIKISLLGETGEQIFIIYNDLMKTGDHIYSYDLTQYHKGIYKINFQPQRTI
jgi:hypothetical protein